MSLDVYKDILYNEEAKTTVKECDKPPLGATPYWLTIENRIEELANAILRYNCSSENIKNIKEWAKEIILYCELAEQMKDITKI